jgi:hypothetical protein
MIKEMGISAMVGKHNPSIIKIPVTKKLRSTTLSVAINSTKLMLITALHSYLLLRKEWIVLGTSVCDTISETMMPRVICLWLCFILKVL